MYKPKAMGFRSGFNRPKISTKGYKESAVSHLPLVLRVSAAMEKINGSDSFRRAVGILKKRCRIYRIEVRNLSETIREKNLERKLLRNIIDHAKLRLLEITKNETRQQQRKRRRCEIGENEVESRDLAQIINEKKQKLMEIREIIHEKKQQQRKLLERINHTKQHKYRKLKLRHKEITTKLAEQESRKRRTVKQLINGVEPSSDALKVVPARYRRKKRSEMTDKELARWLKESKGFDIDEVEYPGTFVGFTNVVPRTISGSRVNYPWICELALSKYNHFNPNKERQFEYVSVLKVNAIPGPEFSSTFFITFLARDKMNAAAPRTPPQTFQAKVGCNVLFPCASTSRVCLVRMKPKKLPN